MSPAAQSKIEEKLSESWELLYGLESQINTLDSRLAPVSTIPTVDGGGEAKSVVSNDSPIAQSMMSQSKFMEKLTLRLDDISARLEC